MLKSVKIHDPNTGATSIFAKLLATEDITVRHDGSASTATFNTKDRVLTLPVWNASKSLYDMLIGHEVGHALFTPACSSDAEFLKELARVHTNAGIAKQYLNVVEDARIERKIKSKFPGLRNDFHYGYEEMDSSNFFGIQDVDADTLSLIDRLNVHFKLGIHNGYEVNFTAEERQFLTRMEDTTSWDDVVDVARDLAAWSEENESTPEQQEVFEDPDASISGGSGEDQDDADADADQGGDDDQDTGDSGGSSTEQGDEDESTPDGDSDDAGPIGDQPTEILAGPQESITQQAQERAMEQMAENRYGGEQTPNYCAAPEYNLDNLIVDIDDIDEYLSRYPKNTNQYGIDHAEENNDFIRTAKSIVGNMVKQFEMKKAADLNRRASIARTGVIDPLRLTRYKFDDDLFLRNMIIPNGKNHGMIMLVDWSSSMGVVIGDTIRQAIVLAMFCKKVGIPFDVYAFSSGNHLTNAYVKGTDDDQWSPGTLVEGFTIIKKTSGLEIREQLQLLHLLSSTSKKNTWTKALNNCLTLCHHRPRSLGLGSTPLDDALIAMPQIIEKFQRTNRCQVMNLIVLTDGDTTGSPLRSYGNGRSVLVARNGEHCDPNSGGRHGTTNACLRYVFNQTGCNIIGMHIADAYAVRNLRTDWFPDNKWEDMNKAKEQIKKENFVQSGVPGYHAHFILNSAEIESGDIFDGLNEDASPTKIRNTFIKALGSRKKAFSYTNRFVDVICSIQGGL